MKNNFLNVNYFELFYEERFQRFFVNFEKNIFSCLKFLRTIPPASNRSSNCQVFLSAFLFKVKIFRQNPNSRVKSQF